MTLLCSRIARAEVLDVRLPMHCSRGSSTQPFSALITIPRSHPSGSVFTVRIDSRPSGIISHFGLYSIFNMTTDYQLSAGAHFVPGSQRLVAGTGSWNVTNTARLWIDNAGLHLSLPARVNNGSAFVPPSIEFDVAVDAPAGNNIALQFTHYHVDASVFLLGEIRTNCAPSSGRATLATVQVSAPTTPAPKGAPKTQGIHGEKLSRRREKGE